MEEIACLLIPAIAVPVVALIYLFQVGRRVARLEQQVRTLRNQQAHVPPLQAPPPLLESLREAPPESVAGACAPHLSTALPISAGEAVVGRISETPSAASDAVPTFATSTTGTQAAPPDVHSEPDRSVESQVGARLAVWLGAAAVVLAVAFFVKYTFDAGLITPAARVLLGVVAGAALCIGGDLVRRSYAGIAQGLVAAGVSAVYISTLAATNLYHFLSPTVGFAALATITAAAIALSLRHGPLVAIFAFIGGFATPALIGSTEPRVGPLFVYLALLQAGLFIVSRQRGRWPLALLTPVAGWVWVLVWTLGANFTPADSHVLGPFVLLSVGGLVFAAPRAGTGGGPWAKIWPALYTVCAGSAGLPLLHLVAQNDFSSFDWSMLALFNAGALVLASRDLRFRHVAGLVAALAALALLNFAAKLTGDAQARFAWVTLAFGLINSLGPFLLLRFASAPLPSAAHAGAGGVVALAIGYWGLDAPPAGVPWGAVAGLVAAAYTLKTGWLLGRASRSPEFRPCAGALSAAAAASLALAAPMELERAWIGVAWALQAPAFLAIAHRFGLRPLRWLAGAVGALAMIWLLRPAVCHYPTGDAVVLNWISYAYGVSALALGAAAWLERRTGEFRGATCYESAALLLLFNGVTLNVRHAFHPHELAAATLSLAESATHVVAWLCLANLLLAATQRWPRATLLNAGRLVTAAALGLALLAPMILRNPLLWRESVGGIRLLNWLLLYYGAPAALLTFVSYEFRRIARTSSGTHAAALGNRSDARIDAPLTAAVALALLFVLVTLQVRQWYCGEFLTGPIEASAEWYTYSAAWALLGLTLAIAGALRRSAALRWGSLAVMLLATFKVFLLDTAQLRDLYRVASLLGLGASLFTLSFLYQRFVFARAHQPDGRVRMAPQAEART